MGIKSDMDLHIARCNNYMDRFSMTCETGEKMKEDKVLSEFVKDRDEAFTRFVMNDDWDALRRYCRKYSTPMPGNRKAAQAGVYKAVQYCTDISEEVKVLAMQKCLKMGFNPFIKPVGYDEE